MRIRKRKIWLLSFFSLTIVFVFLFFCQGNKFDPADWQDSEQIQKGVRLRMADDLIAHNKLHKLTRAEVVKLLGEPPTTNYFQDWDLVYWLGNERGFINIDSEWLAIRLDSDGRVRDYQIVRD
jgi:outer membrane protein assembly factor BamE (lipoprotein component of BamABCDE complex)